LVVFPADGGPQYTTFNVTRPFEPPTVAMTVLEPAWLGD
jgi:hypothetical protein